ncbi:MAG: hypothetical protein HYX75_25065 [Acidobacteria bacterium]|nr:hypothetical protein [Acidobacteriota bacterium]
MAMTVQDLHDLIHLVEMHQEWRAELRRVLLTDELLSLPQIVKELAQKVELIAVEVRKLAEEQRKLAEEQRKLAESLRQLSDAVQILIIDVADTKGFVLELRYERRAHAYFDKVLRRLHVLSQEELNDQLEDACEKGVITEDERHDVLLADLVARGRRLPDRVQTHMVAEVSAKIDSRDVERAVRRARTFAKLGTPVLAVVAGKSITDDAAETAAELGVVQVLDGQVTPR